MGSLVVVLQNFVFIPRPLACNLPGPLGTRVVLVIFITIIMDRKLTLIVVFEMLSIPMIAPFPMLSTSVFSLALRIATYKVRNMFCKIAT
jgi:hypothetical protein